MFIFNTAIQLIGKYRKHSKDRATSYEWQLPPMPLEDSPKQSDLPAHSEIAKAIVAVLSTPVGEKLDDREVTLQDIELARELLFNNFEAGSGQAVIEKARYLGEIALGEKKNDKISPNEAIKELEKMDGGQAAIELLSVIKSKQAEENIIHMAIDALKKSAFVTDIIGDIVAMYKDSSQEKEYAEIILTAWKDMESFTSRKAPPEELKVFVWKSEERKDIPTDHLSKAADGGAGRRPDIALHAYQDMFTLAEQAEMRNMESKLGCKPALVAEQAWLSSSRESARRSWEYFAAPFDRENSPVQKFGAVSIASHSPIGVEAAYYLGGLAIQFTPKEAKELFAGLDKGQVVRINLKKGQIIDDASNKVIKEFTFNRGRDGRENNLKAQRDALQAGSGFRHDVIEFVAEEAANALGVYPRTDILTQRLNRPQEGALSLMQQVFGIRGAYPEGTGPTVGDMVNVDMGPMKDHGLGGGTVGSQNTTGPMTKQVILAAGCTKFSDRVTVVQSLCHNTTGGLTQKDKTINADLTNAFGSRGGVVLPLGDIIHTHLNRFPLPYSINTGGDSHTRTPNSSVCIPGASTPVAKAAILGKMDVPFVETVKIKLVGDKPEHISWRTVSHAITDQAKGQLGEGMLKGKFLEIQGAGDIPVEDTHVIHNRGAEDQVAATVWQHSKEQLVRYAHTAITELTKLRNTQGVVGIEAIDRRIAEFEEFLENPTVLQAHEGAKYDYEVEINLNDIEVGVADVDPEDIKPLSFFTGQKVDSAAIGSCVSTPEDFAVALAVLIDLKSRGETLGIKKFILAPNEARTREFAMAALAEHGGLEEFFDHVVPTGGDLAEDATPMGLLFDGTGCSTCFGNKPWSRLLDSGVTNATRNFKGRNAAGACRLADGMLTMCTAKDGEFPDMNRLTEFREQYLPLAQALLDKFYKPPTTVTAASTKEV